MRTLHWSNYFLNFSSPEFFTEFWKKNVLVNTEKINFLISIIIYVYIHILLKKHNYKKRNISANLNTKPKYLNYNLIMHSSYFVTSTNYLKTADAEPIYKIDDIRVWIDISEENTLCWWDGELYMTPDRTKNVNDTFSFEHEHEKCMNVRDTGFVQTAISSCL